MHKAPTFDELKDFTLKSYVNLLQYLNQIYEIVPFCEIPREDTPYLILRHDIDISLHSALKMAQIERDLGVKSTYFVLFSSKFYNVFEGHNVNILKQISKLDHEIGLHYYVSQYRSYDRNMKKNLKIEIQILEHLLGRKVYSIARHDPWDGDPLAAIKKYINVNHPYMRGDLFIQDSERAWVPLQGFFKLLNDPPQRVQLLIHPENWQEDVIDRETLIERFIQNLEKEIFTLKKNAKKIWMTDPFVVKYDTLIEKGDFFKQLHNEECQSDPTKLSELRKELKYYDTLFRWYMINTSFGWHVHEIFDKIRAILK